MASVTLRISTAAHRILRDLARASGEPMSAVLDRAIEEYRRKRFLEKANEAFASLKLDPKAWARELEERRAWDATLRDDLEKE
jgi:predicted transcriptional regulator